jgi:hypothetical protein
MNTPKGRIATPFDFGSSEIICYLSLLQTLHQQHHHLVCCCFELVVHQLVVELLEQVFEQLLQALEV